MADKRNRFDENEKTYLAEAMEDHELWPYTRPGYAKFMKLATEMLAKHFTTKEKKAYVIPTASGTSSIQVALGGLKIPAGSEVILTPITDPGTVTPIIFHNAIPVFADVDPLSSLITADSVEAVLTPRTTAVIAVHLSGTPVDVPSIRKRLNELGRSDVKIIEDVAQGLGASLAGEPLGMLGEAGCFSLNSHKHITAGEGGFVLVSNEDDFFRCHNYSDKHRDRFGDIPKKAEHGRYKGLGHSLRMSELQGAMLVAQIPKLEKFARNRNAFGVALGKYLAENSSLVPQLNHEKAFATFFGFMFATNNEYDVDTKIAAKDAIKTKIKHLGISASSSYNSSDRPIYRYPVFLKRNFSTNAQDIWPAELLASTLYPSQVSLGHYDYSNVRCPNAESYLRRSFWIWPDETHTEKEAPEVGDAIIAVFKDRGIS